MLLRRALFRGVSVIADRTMQPHLERAVVEALHHIDIGIGLRRGPDVLVAVRKGCGVERDHLRAGDSGAVGRHLPQPFIPASRSCDESVLDGHLTR